MSKRRIIAGLLGVCLIASMILPGFAVVNKLNVAGTNASVRNVMLAPLSTGLTESEAGYCHETTYHGQFACIGFCNNKNNTCKEGTKTKTCRCR